MQLFAECVLSFFAATGLFFLLWLLFDHLSSSNTPRPRGMLVLPAAGDGEGLEPAVLHLLRLRRSGLFSFPVVILDQGLSEAGLRRINALLAREPNLLLYTEHTLLSSLKKDG